MTYRVGDWGKDISFIVSENGKPVDLSNATDVILTITNGETSTTHNCIILDAVNGKVSYRLEKGIITAEGGITFDIQIKWVDAELKIEDPVVDKVN